MYPPVGRLINVAIIISALGFLLFVFASAVPTLDQVSYAQAYVKGNVSHRYMTEAQGAQLLQREEAGLLPYIFQAAGVLGVMIALLAFVGLAEPLSHRK